MNPSASSECVRAPPVSLSLRLAETGNKLQFCSAKEPDHVLLQVRATVCLRPVIAGRRMGPRIGNNGSHGPNSFDL